MLYAKRQITKNSLWLNNHKTWTIKLTLQTARERWRCNLNLKENFMRKREHNEQLKPLPHIVNHPSGDSNRWRVCLSAVLLQSTNYTEASCHLLNQDSPPFRSCSASWWLHRVLYAVRIQVCSQCTEPRAKSGPECKSSGQTSHVPRIWFWTEPKPVVVPCLWQRAPLSFLDPLCACRIQGI